MEWMRLKINIAYVVTRPSLVQRNYAKNDLQHSIDTLFVHFKAVFRRVVS